MILLHFLTQHFKLLFIEKQFHRHKFNQGVAKNNINRFDWQDTPMWVVKIANLSLAFWLLESIGDGQALLCATYLPKFPVKYPRTFAFFLTTSEKGSVTACPNLERIYIKAKRQFPKAQMAQLFSLPSSMSIFQR